MRYVLVFLALVWAAPLSAAEGCIDVWFTRNLIMDRAGFCFSTPLGQALFNNADCRGQQVQLDPQSQAIVNRIRALESEHGCSIDTNAHWIDLPDINFRRVLTSHPIRFDGQWGCLGWTGPVAPLYAGHQEPFHAIGQISPGDYISFEHEAVGQWQYVTAHAPVWGAFKSAGWLYWTDAIPCAAEAG